MRDSYERLFKKGLISKEQLFEFGLSEIIYVEKNIAKIAWDELKDKIETGEEVFIRGFGRDANRTPLYQKFYAVLLRNENVKKDSTNNANPTKMLQEWTGYSKNGRQNFKPIRNYQISHVFSRTKNVYCFTAPWNIVYIPKIIDPFTGHEARGDAVTEFTNLFQQKTYKWFEPLIDDYNNIVTNTDFQSKIENALVCVENLGGVLSTDFDKLKTSIKQELSPIQINA